MRRISERGRMDEGMRGIRAPTDDRYRLDAVYGRVGTREQWRRIRAFSEEETKEALAAMGDSLPKWESAGHDAREMLYYRWAEFDPVAANAAIREADSDGFSSTRAAVMTAWIKQDPSAAWNATKGEEGMWACTRSVRGDVADMLVASYSEDDDATAIQKAGMLGDEEAYVGSIVIETRVKQAAADPERRVAFLRAVSKYPNEVVRNYACYSLFSKWGELDPVAALAAVGTASLPREEIEELRGRLVRAVEEKRVEVPKSNQ